MTDRPQATTIIRIEDDGRVKAAEWVFSPGAETGWHVHEYDYVVVPLVDGTLEIELPDGTTATAALTQGIPYTRRAGVEHNVINAGPAEMRFLEVEITG